MELFKKHVDTIFVLGGLLTAVLWMNSQFNEVRKDIGDLRTDMAIMKTVLIMQKIMPTELAMKDGDKK
jgi:hypothetical protein